MLDAHLGTKFLLAESLSKHFRRIVAFELRNLLRTLWNFFKTRPLHISSTVLEIQSDLKNSLSIIVRRFLVNLEKVRHKFRRPDLLFISYAGGMSLLFGFLLPIFSNHRKITRIPKLRDAAVSEATNASLPLPLSLPETSASLKNLTKHMRSCLEFTLLFPRNYEFDKDNLVQFWSALNFQDRSLLEMKPMEDRGEEYLNDIFSRFNVGKSSEGRLTYRLRDDVYDDLLQREDNSGKYAKLEDVNNKNDIYDETLHASLLHENSDPTILKTFYKANSLQTLLLLNDSGKHITKIPYDMFLKLRCLRVLDLSRTQIKELPSSIGNLGDLSYLDVSETTITRIPESLCKLSNLLILKLHDCFNLFELPKGMKYLTKLQHLEFDIFRQLNFMPPSIGELANLQKLSAFIVGEQEECRIVELKNMVHLRGSLSVVKLENVNTEEEATEAALHKKYHLEKLELRWSVSQSSSANVLEGLKPHTNLKGLKIINYGGLSFPKWFGSPLFTKIEDIYLYNCENCVQLPPLGQLPFLKTLRIGEMHALEEINNQFYGDCLTAGGFPQLESLKFDGLLHLKRWTGINKCKMARLSKLTIVDCPMLIVLPTLSSFESLQHLEISLCPEIPNISTKGLPNSLKSLVITDCPLLENGVDWHKVDDIPTIWINYQQILKS
ncbi:hypothetical protein GIB67_014463 [Kingdonia uniflora]|uniref:Uncharacterized protein n=1 Tax=Kingdonia uniflora TaxID=39325 RepID=A0A7J7LZ45_9MAGN|nr:hypothetical protein GIB67_014463 [Kingdonia uniflora]